nr:hypothetical protein [Pandoravirus aubagnensis]
MSNANDAPKQGTEPFAHYLKDSFLEAHCFLPQDFVVVELHGLLHADVTSAPGRLLGIIGDILCHHGAWGGCGSVPLLSACVLARHPHADGKHDARPAGDDRCAVLAVCATADSDYGLWLACSLAECTDADYRYGVPHPDVKCVVAQICPPVLHECFTRHATIGADGTVLRNADNAQECASCAHTWRGHSALSRRSLRRGPLGRVYDVRLDDSVAARFTLADVGTLCACAVIHDATYQRKDDVARVRRLVGNLLTNIALLNDSCVHAAASGMTGALADVIEREDICCQLVNAAGASAALFWDLQSAKEWAKFALCALCDLRAILDKQAPAREAAPQPVSTAQTVPPFIAEWRAVTNIPHDDADGMFHTSVLMAKFMWMLREHYGPAEDARRARCAEIFKRCRVTRPAGERRRVARSLKAVADIDQSTRVRSDAWQCGSRSCRAPHRRIVSGCMVTLCCTAGCHVTFHRACWEAAHIVCAGRAPCPAPDCRGEITKVTSTRLRKADCRPHIIWQAVSPAPAPKEPAQRGAVQYSTPRRNALSTSGYDLAVDRGHPRDESHDDANHRKGGGCDASVRPEQSHVGGGSAGGLEKWRCALGDATPSISQDVTGEAAQTTGGVAYRKCPLPIEPTTSQRSKRPRDRRGKRQRQRSAEQKQQQDRLLALTGLTEPPASDSTTQPDTDSRLAQYADDALWPSFFVPSAVLG